MIRNLFFDLDDTLLDFRLSERSALTETLVSFGIPVPDALPDRYAAINADYWHRLERGEVTRDTLKVLRFRDLFRVSGITGIDPEAVTHAYEERLASTRIKRWRRFTDATACLPPPTERGTFSVPGSPVPELHRSLTDCSSRRKSAPKSRPRRSLTRSSPAFRHLSVQKRS